MATCLDDLSAGGGGGGDQGWEGGGVIQGGEVLGERGSRPQ